MKHIVPSVDSVREQFDGRLTRREADFVTGVTDIAPLLPAAFVYGLVVGVAATAVGLPLFQAIVISVIIYYPTAMLTVIELLGSGTPGVLIAITGLIIGVRYLLLSLSLAPYFERLSTRWKWVLAYFLWTPNYALSVERFDAEPTTSRRGYYLGVSLPIWVVWHSASIIGLVFGTTVPSQWQLGFVVPLAFIALLVSMLKDRPTTAAAVVAGVLAVLGGELPVESGLVVAALGGTAAGILIDRTVT